MRREGHMNVQGAGYQRTAACVVLPTRTPFGGSWYRTEKKATLEAGNATATGMDFGCLRHVVNQAVPNRLKEQVEGEP